MLDEALRGELVAAPAVGTGRAPGHHGEILQGVFRDSLGQPCRGLVTLPISGLGTRAEFRPEPGAAPESLSVVPADRVKARRAALLTLDLLRSVSILQGFGSRVCGGRLRLNGDLPVGLGMGSSTSDIIAAVRAVADSFGVRLPANTVAALAVRAEQASDPLMLDDRALLFAQREGRVLEVLGDALPPLVVLGCLTGAGRPVNTLDLPTVDTSRISAFERLRRRLRRAVDTADTALLGEVSTESAQLNQQLLPKEELPVLTEIARTSGAVGIQVAHSGNVAGVLFDPAAADLPHRLERCGKALARDGIAVTRVFRTSAARSGRDQLDV
ncbi:GHMP kinase [Saccharopolyspora hirsuta]|uniref:GHMP kinase n=1 Tax=Saccharopolyspora hirsuta TaxID=1837 RepID=A0A5M7C8J4_SACHI|nr:GHMP kinase [Saccharopolyspora hirsuta]KAA5838053.1 GHMP kinase [Saccharopolyspora hirsuta]